MRVRRNAAAHSAACSPFAFPLLPTESPCALRGLRLLGTYVRAHAAFRLPVRGNTRRRRGGRSHLARRCRHSTHVAGRRCPLWQDSRSNPRPSGFHRCTYHWCNAGDAIDPNLQHVIHSGAGIEPLVLGKSTIAGIQRKVNLFNRILINADEDGHISRPCRPSCQVDDIARGLWHSEARRCPDRTRGRTHTSSTASQREGNARAFPIATRCRKRTIPFLQRQTPRRNKRGREPARQH